LDTVQDFEDLLTLLERHGVRYLIIGGLAFIYHAKPRYTPAAGGGPGLRRALAEPDRGTLRTRVAIKRRIDHPRHREDVRVLERVRERRKR